MGADARQGRRTVLSHVNECIALVNANATAVAEVQSKHNTFVGLVEQDVTELRQRLDAQAKWLAKLEREANGDRTAAVATADRLEAFMAGLSLVQRLRWLLTGRVPELQDESPAAAAVPEQAQVPQPVIPPPHDTGIMPAVSLGPKVLP